MSCGQRRGKPRFSGAAPIGTSSAPAGVAALTTAGGLPPEPLRARAGGALTLLAGIATLLVAMGVGVLIGHSASGTPARQSAGVQVIKLSGGAGGAVAQGNGTTASTNSGHHRTRGTPTAGKSHHTKVVVVHLTPKVTQAASQAAGHVFGSSGNLSHNVTQQQNGACSGGAGCQNGKFTGNFFGQ